MPLKADPSQWPHTLAIQKTWFVHKLCFCHLESVQRQAAKLNRPHAHRPQLRFGSAVSQHLVRGFLFLCPSLSSLEKGAPAPCDEWQFVDNLSGQRVNCQWSPKTTSQRTRSPVVSASLSSVCFLLRDLRVKRDKRVCGFGRFRLGRQLAACMYIGTYDVRSTKYDVRYLGGERDNEVCSSINRAQASAAPDESEPVHTRLSKHES